MKLLRSVINVNEKHIVENKILDKIILIESLFISHKKSGYLECYNLACRGILTFVKCKKNELQLTSVEYLIHITRSVILCLHLRLDELYCLLNVFVCAVGCGCKNNTVSVKNGIILTRNILDPINCALKYLIRYHNPPPYYPLHIHQYTLSTIIDCRFLPICTYSYRDFNIF